MRMSADRVHAELDFQVFRRVKRSEVQSRHVLFTMLFPTVGRSLFDIEIIIIYDSDGPSAFNDPIAAEV